ncbi:ubiquitin carboxyl-terminal hydrolase 11 isoform X2 [Copidosoma floridanum]|uniref:ubiquitin carboxyl-terminal hydrolase 11 isoform X2 n=1 Tax=Copidosoma floridanum TaxID=29053 RepID=UPI0006C9784C|nr:ubiquitin carboxyl-terminal hydrolase 11 isoform X2 [Copidosoma floridanum]
MYPRNWFFESWERMCSSDHERLCTLTMISDLPDTIEVVNEVEVSESTGLSPLTTSLDHNLTLHEDNASSNDAKMGVDNTWSEANASTSDYAISVGPLPELDEGPWQEVNYGMEHGPFLPTSTAELNLFSDTNENPDDSLLEANLPAGVCGLSNLGNTCFMAAGLQCLTATPPVLRHFLDLQEGDEKEPPPGSLMANFSTLLSKMWSGKYKSLQPTEFKQTLGAYHSQFKDYRQHDCQEFLALLLDTLHEQMNLAKTNKNCHVPNATATTASDVNSNNQNGDKDFCAGATFLPPSNFDFMDYETMTSHTNPNSPNVTMAGSPRDDCLQDLDSTANSPTQSISPLPNDEETLDSEDVVDLQAAKSSFIYNEVHVNMPHQLGCEIRNKLYDIAKDAKTSNANFLVTPEECNNEIYYDSQKFPKENSRRILLESNLTENHDFDNKSASVKRIKEINCQRNNCGPDGSSGVAGCCGGAAVSNVSEMEYDSGLEKCNVKRMRLEDQEKNHKKDGLAASGLTCSRSLQNCENGATAMLEEVEADKHWAKHLRDNRSVIVDTFQGQFKSTVVCAACKHVSVTYEPFMYLSVPLPHAMERQFMITYIPADGEPPIRCVVLLNKQLQVCRLKEELLKTLNQESIPLSSIVMAEVLENHVAKILEDSLPLRCVDDTNRQIYAFELMDPPEPWVDSDDPAIVPSEPGQSSSISAVPSNRASEETCIICLEENDGDFKKHCENNCTLVMCDTCIEDYFKSGNKPKKCPVCSAELTAAPFAKLDETGQRSRPAVRLLNIPLVLRHDTNEATNNRKSMKLFGDLHVLKLPSRVDAKHIWDMVARIVPRDSTYTLRFVGGQGNTCSRCIYSSHCTGCEVPKSGKVILQTGDTLAVRYVDRIPKVPQPVDHISVSKQRPQHPLSLYDCLQAFSQSETLDEHNPWYCPKCEKNQCATKTLNVHRYPKFLIVYLKRFVFYECLSMKLDNKVTFPLVGLNCGKHLYDLYACVCHFGGVSAGHYTAYAKNPQMDVWHYYNDEMTSKQKPQEEDFSNAYILFYSQQGSSVKQCNI